MIVNAPSVAALLLSVAQAGLAASVCWRSLSAVRAVTRARSPEERDAAEVGALRPALQAFVLVVVLLASWALLIEVLASYVPVWPSVVCIEGVTRIGTGTVGPARHLPWLLDVLFVTKPTLVLLGAAWCAAHAVLRRSGARPGRLGPSLLLSLGLLALLDAAAESAYLLIPKEERFLSSGCCLVANLVLADTPSTWLELVAGAVAPVTAVTGLAASGALLLGALVPYAARREGESPLPRPLGGLLLSATAVGALAGQHLYVAVLGPRVTGISTHRCGWCVVENAPLGALGAGLGTVAAGTVLVLLLAAGLERRAPGAGRAVSRTLARLAIVTLVTGAAGALLVAS